jgi:hypothetical protein
MVKSFYADEEAQKKQIKVCYYKDRENFCVCVADRLKKDVMFLLKSEEEMTVD